MAKVIMHVDLNYFFVRCEEIKNPSLINKPVMIGELGRGGIVSTCSYKAREFGVRSGMPSFKAKALCKDIIMLPGDYHYYSLMSREFFAFAKKYTHIIEKASIDECYMDITALIKKGEDINKLLKEFQEGLFKKTKLYCSIGVASTKFLAKMASDMKKPMGITIIRNRDIVKMLYPLKIEDFFGIGKKSAPRLRSIGINTIGDLANLLINNKEAALNIFGKYYYDLFSYIKGNSSDEIIVEYEDPKSIGNSMTLIHDTDEEEEIYVAIRLLSKSVSERAKRDKLKGKTVQLVVKEPNFTVHNKSITVDKAIDDVNDISAIAIDLYNKNYLKMNIRLVGVTLQNLVSRHESNIQMSLFDYEQYNKKDDINVIINNVNRKFKKKVVDKASIILKENKYGNK